MENDIILSMRKASKTKRRRREPLTDANLLLILTINSIVITADFKEPWWQSITTGAMLCFFILLQSVVLALRGKSDFEQVRP